MTGLDWRPLRVSEAAALAELMAAAEQIDRTGENWSVEDVTEDLGDPRRDPERDGWVVYDGERMVAYGMVIGSPEVWDVHTVGCPGVVHPEHRGRGIGSELVVRQLARAAELHREWHPQVPGRVSFGVNDEVRDGVDLMQSQGFTPQRQFFDMQRDLRTDAPARRDPSPPLRLAGYDAERDEEVRRAHNVSFRGHYGSTERDPASWKQWFTGSRNFRPELSFLVLDDDADGAPVAAYLLAYFYEADQAATGVREAWIGQLGTLPGYRGRGAASVLLTQALASYRDQGYDRASLDVDSANGTGALGMYERVGFAVTKSWTSWTRDLTG